MKSISLTPAIYDYVLRHRTRSKDPVLDDLRHETTQFGSSAYMQIPEEQGSFLTILVGALGVKNALEIGTFTGTSAISIARGLPADGKLICLDISGEWTNVAQKFWHRAGVADKIELRLGDARETVKEVEGPLDFIFLDADKESYELYYETTLPLLKTGGLILFDNMLRHGRVLNPQETSDQAIAALNSKLAVDSRVEVVLLPLADGIMMCRKL